MTEKWGEMQGKWALVRVSGEFELSVKMTEKWVEIQGKCDLARVSGGVELSEFELPSKND